MDPLAELVREHQTINRVINAFESFLDAVDEGLEVDQSRLHEFVGFFESFVEGHHHVKEEDILFARLADLGVAALAGPIQQMLEDHRHSRVSIAALAAAAASDEPWTMEKRSRIADLGYRYAEAQRDHMQLEDEIFYPLARGSLDHAYAAEVAEAWLMLGRSAFILGRPMAFDELVERLTT